MCTQFPQQKSLFLNGPDGERGDEVESESVDPGISYQVCAYACVSLKEKEKWDIFSSCILNKGQRKTIES